jgi:adenine nucleotide transporter 17
MTIIDGTSAFPTMFSNLFSLQNFLQAICGALGSCFSMTMLHPFEISRTRLQVDPNLTPRSSIPLIFSIHKNEGLAALYQGWASIIYSLSVTNFVYFFAFHGMRLLPGSATASNDLLWAAVAGIFTVFVTSPLWVANTRLKLGNASKQKGENKRKQYSTQTSTMQCMMDIVNNEGWKALWSGTSSSLLLVTNPSIQFVVYEALKRSPLFLFPDNQYIRPMLNGALCKVVPTIATYPLQVIQTQRRAGVLSEIKKNGDKATSSNLLVQLSSLIQRDGFRVLFSGLESKLIQTCLSGAIMFFVYEELSNQVYSIAGVER